MHTADSVATMARRIAVALLLAWLLAPSASASAEVVATSTKATPVAAAGGVVAWSDYDAASDSYFLTTDSSAGGGRAPVAPRRIPFDADVGVVGGRALVTYSRCRSDQAAHPGGSDLPDWTSTLGCRLWSYDPATGVERPLAVPQPRGASLSLPSAWGDQVAYVATTRSKRKLLYRNGPDGLHRLGKRYSTPQSPYASTAPIDLDLRDGRTAVIWAGVPSKTCPTLNLRLGPGTISDARLVSRSIDVHLLTACASKPIAFLLDVSLTDSATVLTSLGSRALGGNALVAQTATGARVGSQAYPDGTISTDVDGTTLYEATIAPGTTTTDIVRQPLALQLGPGDH